MKSENKSNINIDITILFYDEENDDDTYTSNIEVLGHNIFIRLSVDDNLDEMSNEYKDIIIPNIVKALIKSGNLSRTEYIEFIHHDDSPTINIEFKPSTLESLLYFKIMIESLLECPPTIQLYSSPEAVFYMKIV